MTHHVVVSAKGRQIVVVGSATVGMWPSMVEVALKCRHATSWMDKRRIVRPGATFLRRLGRYLVVPVATTASSWPTDQLHSPSTCRIAICRGDLRDHRSKPGQFTRTLRRARKRLQST